MSKKPTGFGDVANPFGEVDDLQDVYVPPNTSSLAWERQPQSTTSAAPEAESFEDDEPFTAAHLAAASQSAVPAITSTGTAAAAGPSVPPPRLDFTTSVAPAGDLSGRIGAAPAPPPQPAVPAVSRLGSAPDTTRLLGAGSVSSSAPAGGSSPPDLPIEDPSSYPFYNIKRYRTYFNVDTNEVLHRIFRAVACFFRGDFFDHIGNNPDLYGPFWIASTLVFVSAAAGNTASYLNHRAASGGSGGTAGPPSAPDSGSSATGWYYDVDKVGGSMGLFYGYVGVIGMLLWIVLRWGFKAGVSLAQVWCAYGYALAAYIPMAALCVLPMEVVRWSLVGAATAISGIFLVLNFKVVIVEAAGAQAVPLLMIMVGLHAVLGLALKLYFFQYSA